MAQVIDTDAEIVQNRVVVLKRLATPETVVATSLGGMFAFQLGVGVFLHDIRDFEAGKPPFRSAEEVARGESPVHHYLVGLVLAFLGLLSMVFGLFLRWVQAWGQVRRR